MVWSEGIYGAMKGIICPRPEKRAGIRILAHRISVLKLHEVISPDTCKKPFLCQSKMTEMLCVSDTAFYYHISLHMQAAFSTLIAGVSHLLPHALYRH